MNQFPITQDLILKNKNGWLEIRLNNAVNRNALKESLVEELLIVFEVAKDNTDIRGIVLRGDGGVFCAGADLKKMKKITESGREAKNEAYDLSMTIGKLLKVINQAPQIVVSVTEGFALAGGFGIACASDFVISLENTKFGLTETKIGLTPSQISKYVINKLGYSKARKMMLLGTLIDGLEASKIGLVDFVAKNNEALEKKIKDFKSQVNDCSPTAVATTKKILSFNQNIDSQRAADLFSDSIISNDGKEGFESFFNKRKPSWTIKK